MTTKKIVAIVAIILIAIALLVVLFAGGVLGFVFYSIGNSDAANTARDYLRNNEKLKQDIGDVKDFGSFVTGNIAVQNGDGDARLKLKVIGSRKTVEATIDLTYRSGHAWRVVSASYTNEQAERIELLNPYDSRVFKTLLAA